MLLPQKYQTSLQEPHHSLGMRSVLLEIIRRLEFFGETVLWDQLPVIIHRALLYKSANLNPRFT
jgi:hypothetical protein